MIAAYFQLPLKLKSTQHGEAWKSCVFSKAALTHLLRFQSWFQSYKTFPNFDPCCRLCCHGDEYHQYPPSSAGFNPNHLRLNSSVSRTLILFPEFKNCKVQKGPASPDPVGTAGETDQVQMVGVISPLAWLGLGLQLERPVHPPTSARTELDPAGSKGTEPAERPGAKSQR